MQALIGLLICTCFVHIVHPPFLEIFGNSNQFVQLKFYFVQIIRNFMVRNFMVPTYAYWINLGHGNHNHNTIDHIQPIEITNELLRWSQGLSSKNLRNSTPQIIIIYIKKLQFNSLMWGSLTLAPN